MNKLDDIAKIIDPDAWHETLPTDGCGVYWIGRRNTARSKAEAVLAAIGDSQPTALLEEVGAWVQALAEADLDEGAADAVTVGMVFQQQASNVYLPRIIAALHKGNTDVQG